MKKILLVEDEEVLVRLIKRLLGDRYELFIANSLQQGMDLLSSNVFDLLITDWRLKDGNASGLLREANKRYPGLRCILVTGFLETDEFKQDISGFTFCARFQKPFDIDEFQAAVDKYLS